MQIKTFNNPEKSDWPNIIERPVTDYSELEPVVKQIFNTIKSSGDTAVKDYTLKFDKVNLDNIQVSKQEIQEAKNNVSQELKDAIEIARKNIEAFHTAQQTNTKVIETMPGVRCWQKSVPIEKVGLYIPGGSAPLFSTILMLGIPAIIAGCKEVILCSPPGKDGNLHPAIIYTASLIGIDKIFKVGGVQAIAAMTLGTKTIPKVYKLFGPGNQYVTVAKQLATQYGAAIDMPAGPSELLVIADDTANAAFVAADLLSQAEHGADSQVILLTRSNEIASLVKQEVENQLAVLPRKNIASESLKSSAIVTLNNDNDIIDFTNQYAPEHLIIATQNFEELSSFVINAGSVFLGNYSTESAGDYASGTNHTLPTNGYANAYSGVNLDSFIKKITYQHISKEGIKNIGSAIEIMADEEQLFAHKNAVTLRLNEVNK